MKPDNDFFLPFDGMADFPEGGTGTGPEFWEHISDLLERIEKNTRAITSASGNTVNAPIAGRATRVVERPSREHGKSVLPLSQPVASRTAKAERAAFRRASSPTPSPSPATLPQDNTHASDRESVTSRVPSQSVKKQPKHAERAEVATPTKSQQEHVRRREEAVASEQSRGVLGILKKNLASWDGSVAAPDKGELQNAAGLAAGGPVWSAIKEVKEAVESSDGDDDSSLSGILKKTLADKTGVTGAKDRIAKVKESARAKVIAWAGGKPEENKDALKGKRDSDGRFLRASDEASSTSETRIAEESYALATREAAADKKRHDELIEAVKNSENGAAGSRLFGKDGLLDRVRGRRRGSGRGTGRSTEGRQRSLGGMTGRRAQTAGVPRGRRRGKLGLLAGGLTALAGGASLLSEDPTDIALDLGEAALTAPGAGKAVATTAKAAGGLGKAGGTLGKVAGLGVKGVMGAAKAIPVAGQLLAAGMAVKDGVQGWNDTDMQQEAFGLADGQEASTGQKASTAAANVLDMGGLFTGAASLMGFDVSTADMAKGLYSAGDAIGSTLTGAWDGLTGLFSGGSDVPPQDSAVSTALPLISSNPLVGAFSMLGGGEALGNLGHAVASWFSDEKDPPPVTSSSDLAEGGAALDDNSKGILESLGDSLGTLVTEIGDFVKEEMPMGGFLSNVTSWFGGSSGAGNEKTPSGNGVSKVAIAPPPADAGLGALSARYESGRLGSEAVGWDGTGGTSYGKYQIATRTGTMNNFLKYAKEQNPEVYQRLMAAGPADSGKNGAFAQEWKALAAEGKMGNLEHDFIKASHFDPAFAGIKNEKLRAQIQNSKAMQDVLWSTSVQHGAGGASKLLNTVYKDGMSEEDVVQALYAARGTKFGSSSAAVQRSVQGRFENEQETALAMLQAEKQQAGSNTSPASQESTESISRLPQEDTAKLVEASAATRGEKENTVIASTSPAQHENVSPLAGTPAVPVRAEESPVQIAAVQELPPQPAPRYPDPEPMRPEPAANMAGSGITAQMVALLSQLLDVTRQQGQTRERDTEAANTPNIPMEYDNAYCANIAHDRA